MIKSFEEFKLNENVDLKKANKIYYRILNKMEEITKLVEKFKFDPEAQDLRSMADKFGL